MLSQSARRRQQDRVEETSNRAKDHIALPSVRLLLKIDAEYRHRAETNQLQKIVPRRFNPTDEAWLPIYHTKREGWSFTVLYSNTAQAHRLDKTHDWVVIYYERDGKERQNTVVTENQGKLKDKRIVRGRGEENRQYYSSHEAPAAASA